MSLRVRLTLVCCSVSVLVIAVLGILAYSVHGHALYDGMDRVLVAALDHAQELHNLPPLDTAPPVATITPLLPNVAAWVSLADGHRLAATPNAFLAPHVAPGVVLDGPSPPPYGPVVALAPHWEKDYDESGKFATVETPGRVRWRLYVRPSSGGADGHFVVAAAPLATIDATLAEFATMLLVLGAGGWVLTPLVALLLAGRALEPVATLTETARSIARSRRLDQRVPVIAPRDELGELAATFNEMLTSIEEAYQAQQRFVADASHELRAPLTAIQANLELVQRRPELAAAERELAAAEALRETRRLASLVEQLLTLARSDAGVPLRRQQVELDRIVLETLAEVRHLRQGQELQIEHIEPVVIAGDPDRLKQVLVILCHNALKYTPAGGAVALGLRRRGAAAEVTVSDTGVGIAPPDLPHVFERFYRADPARGRDPGGTGLGLAIAKRIALDHGGDVMVKSEVGKGTVVTMILPVAP